MKNELFLKFVEFCEKQPIHRPIIHNSWLDCTIGDFYRDLGEEISYGSDITLAAKLLNSRPFSDARVGSIYSDLNSAKNKGVPYNYGDFTVWLKAHPDFNRTAGLE